MVGDDAVVVVVVVTSLFFEPNISPHTLFFARVKAPIMAVCAILHVDPSHFTFSIQDKISLLQLVPRVLEELQH